MKELTVSQASQPHIDRYARVLPQALLLSGASGVGLHTIALHVAKNHGDTMQVKPELLTKTSTVPQISIERIRELYEQTRTRSNIGRVIIIDDSDTMTFSAQNAFLKLLEEPNQFTRFILTSHHPEALLPTIRSRLEAHHVTPVSSEQSAQLLDAISGLTAQKRTQLRFIAEGLPAELYRLTTDDMAFREKASRISTAKQLIEANQYGKTVILIKEKLTRKSAEALAEQLVQLLSRTPNETGVKRIEQLLVARECIASGGNIKLQLLRALL